MTRPRWFADRLVYWSEPAAKLLKIAATCAMILGAYDLLFYLWLERVSLPLNIGTEPPLLGSIEQRKAVQGKGRDPSRESVGNRGTDRGSAEQQRINSAKMNYKDVLEGRRTSLMNAFALATVNGDADERPAAISEFNRRNPELAIGMNNLRASLRGRQLASRQSQNGIRGPPRLQAGLNASVGLSD